MGRRGDWEKQKEEEGCEGLRSSNGEKTQERMVGGQCNGGSTEEEEFDGGKDATLRARHRLTCRDEQPWNQLYSNELSQVGDMGR